jgi:hypothetical protein
MLLITNYTGHPQLAFRSGFTDQPTRTIFGGAADDSGDTFSVPYATSLWGRCLMKASSWRWARRSRRAWASRRSRPSDFA